ncbi:MAG: hypothetical protein M5U28_11940 [Sandaracinaceae bacterium]|nr:hypothetical protein [Sandaracinaceae bacterium]
MARLIAKVKSTPIDPLILSAKVASFKVHLTEAFKALDMARSEGNAPRFLAERGAVIPDFPNRDYWFLPDVQEELALLVALINQEQPRDFVDFLYVVFSAIIITKGKTSVANVMDLAHSRPHYRSSDGKTNAFERFMERLDKLTGDMMSFSSQLLDKRVNARVVGVDARSLPIPDDSGFNFHFPPYVNAIDYPRAHKFSIFWMPEYLGISSEEYKELGTEYIGTDRVPKSECIERIENEFAIPILDSVIQELADQDLKRAGVTHRYFDNMLRAIAEMCQVVKPGRFTGIVVGPSRIKNIYVPTHQLLAEISAQTTIVSKNKHYSFTVQDIYRRTIDDSKRQLPYIRGEFGPGMRDEYVIILQKRSG